MAESADIQDAVERIPAGTKVRLKLKSGEEIAGTVKGDTVEDSERQVVELDEVTSVLTVHETEGPE